MDDPSPAERTWHLDGYKTYAMTALGIVAVLPGLYGFSWISHWLGWAGAISMRVTSPDQTPAAIAIVLGVLVGIGVLIGALFVVHEWFHGLAFRVMGARPRYGAKWINRFFLVLYATAPGRWIGKGQYMTVMLAPTVAVNLLGLGFMAAMGEWSWVLIFPLAIHLGGCVGDWWSVVVLLGLPRAIQIEDTADGFRYKPK